MIVLDGTLGHKSLFVEEGPTLTLPVLRTSLYFAVFKYLVYIPYIKFVENTFAISQKADYNTEL